MKSILGWTALLATALLAACASVPTAAPTMTSVPPTAVSESPTALPAASATPVEAAVEDYCIDCHMDQDKLVASAAAEEPQEEESEGVG